MDSLRRGWIGLVLFLAALVLMPVLVYGYGRSDVAGRGSDALSVDAPAPTATVDPLGPMASTAPVDAGLTFTGIREDETIYGFRQIQIESERYSGSIEYVLNGPISPFLTVVGRAPYIFSPQDRGWQTTAVPNGQYTLTAIPTEVANAAISISFTVSNQSAAFGAWPSPAAQPSGAASGGARDGGGSSP
ncbi:hypothetical protein [Frankia sp. AgKG'84/4]|uniref:hypothetical protein n=1 Tax=Frankia sp. AgKG'84/4 TaxID=573490 RepID=UPI00200FA920|nr:hypothetical protein [Frankia sp. AgKG'84/4]MCL9795400.1 hypothetical protein [Frankia sp. AgKG'84/4]